MIKNTIFYYGFKGIREDASPSPDGARLFSHGLGGALRSHQSGLATTGVCRPREFLGNPRLPLKGSLKGVSGPFTRGLELGFLLG